MRAVYRAAADVQAVGAIETRIGRRRRFALREQAPAYRSRRFVVPAASSVWVTSSAPRACSIVYSAVFEPRQQSAAFVPSRRRLNSVQSSHRRSLYTRDPQTLAASRATDRARAAPCTPSKMNDCIVRQQRQQWRSDHLTRGSCDATDGS